MPPAKSDSGEGRVGLFQNAQNFIIKDGEMYDLHDNATVKKYEISVSLHLDDTSSRPSTPQFGERNAQVTSESQPQRPQTPVAIGYGCSSGNEALQEPPVPPQPGITSSSASDNNTSETEGKKAPIRDLYRTTDTHPVPLLLSIVREKQPEDPLMSVVDKRSVNLMYKILSDKDHTGIAAQLIQESDVKDMLDIILCLTLSGYMNSSDNKLARQLMFKVLKKRTVIPRSLFVTGARIQADRDYISAREFGFASVLEGELPGNISALKISYETRTNIKFCHAALTWRALSHRYVLPFLGVYEDEIKSQFFLVLPYMKNGTLAQWRKKSNPSTTEIQKRVKPFFFQPHEDIDSSRKMLEVAQGLQYIHLEGVVHGNLCGDNVLLDDSLQVQIADFGLTRISEATASARSQALHYNFAAPELFRYQPSSGAPYPDDSDAKMQKTDIYAFGCLYYEIHYGAMPFADKIPRQIEKLVSRGKRPPRLHNPPLGDRTWHLIEWCWEMKAMERPSTDDIVNCMNPGNPGSLILQKRQRTVLIKKIREITIRALVILATGVLLSYCIPSIFPILITLLRIPSPKVTMTIEARCGGSLDTVEDWHIRTFHPKWFGLSKEPVPIVHRTSTWGNKAHQITVVDIDQRDIEIRMWVDNQDLGYKVVDLDSSVDCKDNIDECLRLGFGFARVVVPPGRHTIRAEIRKRNKSEAFDWGNERQRRVMWAVHRCDRTKVVARYEVD